MANLHEITNRALRQWIEVTGVNPDAFTWGDYNIHRINEYIRSAQDFDPTGLTAFMVTRAVAHDYVKDHSFNAMDIITADSGTKARIEALGGLFRLVDDPEALAIVSEFQDDLRRAAEHYGVLRQTAGLIDDTNALSHVRRDALVCTDMLEHHTFAKGRRADGALKYNERVLKFWNMNSLIRAAQIQPTSGISIVLVRDPNVIEFSFFCFLVRDGENISIWTDAEKGAHPMQKYMSRSRSRTRQLRERMSRLRFPYQLLEVRFDDEGKCAFEVTGDALVRTNIEAVTIARIEDLEPDQILWAIMALDVLRKEGHQENLSGTGEGMAYQLSPGSKAALPPGYLEAVNLTKSDVSAKTIDQQLEACEGRSPRSTGVNNWMEDRYGDQVDPRLYNLTNPQVSSRAIKASEEEDHKVGSQKLVLWGRRINATALLPDSRGFRSAMAHVGEDTVRRPRLIGMDPVDFGTREEMEADRLWIARWNQSVALGMASVAEFDRRKDQVVDWFDERVRSNSRTLLDAVVRGELSVGRRKGGLDKLIKWYRLQRGDSPDGWRWRLTGGANVSLFQTQRRHNYPTKSYPLRCFVTGEAASIWIRLAPSTPEGIAALAGVNVSDLPEPLEHWNPNPPYSGNSILDRTDPLDTLVGNPWLALTFEVMIGLSKREWKRRVKACNNPGKIRFQVEKSRGPYSYWEYEDET